MKLKCFEIFQYVTNSREGFHQPLPPGVQRWGYDCVYIRGLKESRLAGCKPVGYPQLAFRAGIELEGGGGGGGAFGLQQPILKFRLRTRL